ncbi:MAG: nitroreductase [Burkholderiaceae bacterium]
MFQSSPESQDPLGDVFRESRPGGFAGRPVERTLIEEVLGVARRAPSGVNTQPWNVFVLRGQSLSALVAQATQSVAGWTREPDAEARFWEMVNRSPGVGEWPAQDAQHCGDALLSAAFAAGHAGVSGGPGSAQELLRYFRFFDAPVGLLFTISQTLGLGSVLDYGMFLHNITLAARARGLRTCVQTGWRGMAPLVLPRLGAPADMLLLCGMALGYSDATQPAIGAASALPAVADFTTWHG